MWRENRRRHLRTEASAQAWLRLRREPSAIATRSLDLTPEGARFARMQRVTPGEDMLTHLQLQDNDSTIECKARVCWCSAMPNGLYEFGVRFVDLLEDEKERIKDFLVCTKARPAMVAV